ncbi:MAG: hypothetical protein H7Z37_00280 [Pyrinomonadaceae bacterium]|nr:hypothetical protein [Pyrinomonadaceae bacterium]
MKLLLLSLLMLLPSAASSQTERQSKSPVEILYGSSKSDSTDKNKKTVTRLFPATRNAKQQLL